MRARRGLAAAQTVPVAGDVDANLEQHVGLARAAADRGAGVVVFPELSLTGYELERADELAFAPDDGRLTPLVDLAAACGLLVVVGAPVRLADGPLHIGAFLIGPDGPAGLYTKRHLGAGEERYVTPGDLDPFLEVGGLPAAVAVCADSNYPSHPAAARGRGAETYLVSSFIAPLQFERRTTGLRAYAVEHSMTVVFSNYGGPTGGLSAAGGSAIWSPDGAVLARVDGVGRGLAVTPHS